MRLFTLTLFLILSVHGSSSQAYEGENPWIDLPFFMNPVHPTSDALVRRSSDCPSAFEPILAKLLFPFRSRRVFRVFASTSEQGMPIGNHNSLQEYVGKKVQVLGLFTFPPIHIVSVKPRKFDTFDKKYNALMEWRQPIHKVYGAPSSRQYYKDQETGEIYRTYWSKEKSFDAEGTIEREMDGSFGQPRFSLVLGDGFRRFDLSEFLGIGLNRVEYHGRVLLIRSVLTVRSDHRGDRID